MKVLMISSDRKIFDPDSPVRRRMMEYGAIFEQLHVIVFTKHSQGHTFTEIAPNAWAYPTDSWMKLDYFHDAIRLAREQLVINGEFTPEVVSAQDPFETGLVGWLIARKFKRKLQLQVHTDFFDSFFLSQGSLNRVRRLLAGFLLPRAQCVRVVSERVKEYLEKHYSSLVGRIAVLPIHVDTEYYRDAKPRVDLHKKYPQFSFILLMVSRLTPEKYYPFALEVFSKIHARYPRAGLIIVGSGPEERRIQQKARELRISNAVVLEGWQEDIVSYYKTANLLLHTSRFEGYGMVFVEAAASGLPMVASDVGVAASVARALPGSGICPVGDRECFVKQIFDFIENNERRLYLRLNASGDVSLGGLLVQSKEEYLVAYANAMKACFARPETSSKNVS